jgi:hypothetical protein
MQLVIDHKRGKELALLLYELFATKGIFGKTVMPEDLVPEGVMKGSIEHILFLTQTVSIDYQRDANALWASARNTFEDRESRYLFEPDKLSDASYSNVIKDMQRHKLSKKQKKDASIWRTIGVSFHKKWQNNPLNFIESCDWDALVVLDHLKRDTHLNNNKPVPDYPYLRGNKIGPLWLRMLRDNAEISQLKNMDKVPIPVDIHVARATLATGVVRGIFKGSLESLFDHIREAWFRSMAGLTVRDRPKIALDVDEPLWHLSKYGCTERITLNGGCPRSQTCEVKEYCINGRIDIRNGFVELDT